MTRHRCGLWLALIVTCLGCGFFSDNAALAQSSQIPVELRTKAPLTQADQDSLNKIVTTWVGDLQSPDPTVQSRARDLLIDGIRDQGQVQNTATYRSAYARALDAALVAIPNNAEIRTRLNAAIVTARVAELARNNGLLRATIKYLGDDSLPVALWGMKAARWILPFEAANPLFAANNPLLNAIPAALQKHPSAAMYEEAYLALALELFNPAIPKPPPAAMTIVVPVVHQAIQTRVQQAAGGQVDQPSAEVRPAALSFLAGPEVYRAQPAPLRLATVQALVDYMDAIAKKAAPAAGAEKSTYIQLLIDLGGVAYVIGGNEGSAKIQSAATAIRQLQINSPPDEITAAVTALQDAFRGEPAFSGLKAPGNNQPQNTGGTAPGAAGGTVAGG
jgi:hypothetical protein